MAAIISRHRLKHGKNGYPTSDGRPLAETDRHRQLMFKSIKTLETRFADDMDVYVSGNLLVFYERGNRLRHLSPDVFVVKGVHKHERPNYLIWEERKGLDFVLELTSSSTKEEDIDDKFWLYENVLKVGEYFLFDPQADYLKPPLQGYRLSRGHYAPIKPTTAGRLESKVLGLHLEQNSNDLRFYDPLTEQYILSPEEQVERLRREVEELRRRLNNHR